MSCFHFLWRVTDHPLNAVSWAKSVDLWSKEHLTVELHTSKLLRHGEDLPQTKRGTQEGMSAIHPKIDAAFRIQILLNPLQAKRTCVKITDLQEDTEARSYTKGVQLVVQLNLLERNMIQPFTRTSWTAQTHTQTLKCWNIPWLDGCHSVPSL